MASDIDRLIKRLETKKPAGWYEKYTVTDPKELVALANSAASSANTMQTSSRQGNLASSMLAGASSGAALGSLFPGIGTGFGAVAGAGLGALQTAFGEKEEEPKEDPDIRKSLQLQNKLLEQQVMERQRRTNWMTKVRNSLKYR